MSSLHHFYTIHSASQTFSSGFFSSFFGDLMAGLIIALLFSIFYPLYLDFRKKAKVTIINRDSRNKFFELTQSSDGQWEATLKLAIKNNGVATLNCCYYTFLIPSELNAKPNFLTGIPNPEVVTFDIGQEEISHNRLLWKRWYGLIKDPQFPGRSYIYPYEIKIKVHAKKEYKIYYYFSTEYGTYPEKAKLIDENLEHAFEDEYLDYIVLH